MSFVLFLILAYVFLGGGIVLLARMKIHPLIQVPALFILGFLLLLLILWTAWILVMAVFVGPNLRKL